VIDIRDISRRTGLSRNTVRKYLRSDSVEPKFNVPDRPSKLDPYADKLSQMLRQEAGKSRKQKRTVKQLHADLTALGYDGSYNRVAAFAREWKVARHREQQTCGRGTNVPRRPVNATEQTLGETAGHPPHQHHVAQINFMVSQYDSVASCSVISSRIIVIDFLTSPVSCIGSILPSSAMNGPGLSMACALRYPISPSRPPARVAASRMASFKSAVVLFGVPFVRPPNFRPPLGLPPGINFYLALF
jgi:hypothetical protein